MRKQDKNENPEMPKKKNREANEIRTSSLTDSLEA